MKNTKPARVNAATKIALCLAQAAVVFSAQAAGEVDLLINEIRIDQPGSDNDEYFELFGAPGTPLTGLTYVVIGDGAGGSGVIDAAISLSGQSIGANGFFVAAESTFTLATADLVTNVNFENSDNVTHVLVGGFSGFEGQDLDTNDDGVLDVVPWTAEFDRIALIEQDNPPTFTEFHYGPPTVGPDGTFVPGFVKRCPDGGTFEFGVFDPGSSSDTPGGANDCDTSADIRTIAEIQGASHTSPEVGNRVIVESVVVTAVTGDGFYIQDPVGDGDDATSEGLYVFTGTAPSVSVQNEVRVEGNVAEFTPGGTNTGNLSITQITQPSTTVTQASVPLPDAVQLIAANLPNTEVITDDGTVPFDPENDPLDYYETFEGMRVVVVDAVAVGARDRFNEITVIASNGAGATGRNARGGITLTDGDTNPERIELQLFNDFTPGFDPAVNVGDALGDVEGVLDYRFGFFEVRVTAPFTVTPAGLQPTVTTLASGPQALTIASYNVLNLDPIVENPANCSDGVDDIDDDVGDGRFAVIAEHIAINLGGPDIVALQEIQDGDGCENVGLVSAAATYTQLAADISAAGGPIYSFAEIPPVDGQDGGQPGGNIRVGYLYDASRVSLVGGSLMRIVDSNLGDGDAFNASRKPLLASFAFGDDIVTVINAHSSSKGGSTPLFGATFPAVNGREAQRAAQMAEINLIVDQILANDAEANIVVLGDLNEFEFTTSVFDALTGAPDDVLEVLTRRLPAEERYTFAFNGNSQALDHAAVSAALSPRADIDLVHVNAEFQSTSARGSDHDPVLVRLDFGGTDTDGDGVADEMDNCTLVPNADQRDSNGDGFGNLCDADLDNNGVVNFIDLGLLRLVFFTADADADFNGDGVVNFVDLGLLRAAFFGPPGPSGLAR
ncbi:MAG: endonuclease/exonuclease/phosphatase family protein [Pseudomonadota bacterium]